MKAFIYAAGRATRLGPAYAQRPKILVEVGGKTLLEWHARRLAENRVRELFVITGHHRDQTAALLPRLAKDYGVEAREIFNPDFNEGSVLSVAVSLPEVAAAGPSTLLMDGDVLYPGEMLRRLIQSPHRTALLVDRNFSTDDDDPVLVPVQAGSPFDFVKGWTGKADSVGESIGFFKVDAADLPLLVSETNRRLLGQARRDSYDEVLRAMVKAGRFGYEDVTGLAWTEVDFPKDIDYAREVVLPGILGRQVKPR